MSDDEKEIGTKDELLAKANRIGEELGEEAKRVYLLHFIQTADSILKYMEHRNDPMVQCPKKDGKFQCSFKTRAKEQRTINYLMKGHHCEVDDHGLSGAYAYVIVDESGKLLRILYPGFGKNLCKSLRFLSLVYKWAKAPMDSRWVRERDTLDDLFKECKKKNYRIHLVLFEMDENHEKSYWGSRFEGVQGISHHAEGVLLEQFKKRRLGEEGGMFEYCLNWMPGWTDKKKFKDFDFKYYLSVIEEKIRLGDSLILEEADFESLARIMRKNNHFHEKNSILKRGEYVRHPTNFNDMIADLRRIELAHHTRFIAMPEPMPIRGE